MDNPFYETLPEQVPDLTEFPYIIVVTIREDDAIHAFDINGIKFSQENLQKFAEVLSHLRYKDSGVSDAIDQCYIDIGNAVCQEMKRLAP